MCMCGNRLWDWIEIHPEYGSVTDLRVTTMTQIQATQHSKTANCSASVYLLTDHKVRSNPVTVTVFFNWLLRNVTRDVMY